METLGPQDIKERMKTFHKKHDEDMNYNCKKCITKFIKYKISTRCCK